MPGHDQKLRAAIEAAVGGLIKLKEIAERETGKQIICSMDE